MNRPMIFKTDSGFAIAVSTLYEWLERNQGKPIHALVIGGYAWLQCNGELFLVEEASK